MALPWNYQRWIQETSVDGTIYGLKSRSTLLVAIDQALRSYDSASPIDKLRDLHQLKDAFEAWAASKNDVATSIRNKDGHLLTDFKQWMGQQEKALLPVKEEGWAGTPNCYAYAMKCKQVAGNAPVPGAAAGKAVFATRDNQELYPDRLFQGIVDDAEACEKAVEILQGPSPSPMPTDKVTGANYIAAMVVKPDGFHFMRRDSRSGLWSHKNGAADAEVETTAKLLPTGAQRIVRQMPITDAVAVELLRCTEGKYIAFTGFKFAGYILVPDEGITVKGTK